MNLFGAKIEVEGHILKFSDALNSLQHNPDLLVDSVIKLGVLQPQVISPFTLMDVLIRSIPTFPKRHLSTLPFEQGLIAFNTQII